MPVALRLSGREDFSPKLSSSVTISFTLRLHLANENAYFSTSLVLGVVSDSLWGGWVGGARSVVGDNKGAGANPANVRSLL